MAEAERSSQGLLYPIFEQALVGLQYDAKQSPLGARERRFRRPETPGSRWPKHRSGA